MTTVWRERWERAVYEGTESYIFNHGYTITRAAHGLIWSVGYPCALMMDDISDVMVITMSLFTSLLEGPTLNDPDPNLQLRRDPDEPEKMYAKHFGKVYIKVNTDWYDVDTMKLDVGASKGIEAGLDLRKRQAEAMKVEIQAELAKSLFEAEGGELSLLDGDDGEDEEEPDDELKVSISNVLTWDDITSDSRLYPWRGFAEKNNFPPALMEAILQKERRRKS